MYSLVGIRYLGVLQLGGVRLDTRLCSLLG